MDAKKKAIDRVVNIIDWKKIKSYHKKLGIYWEFVHDKETVRRIPNVAELKNELRSLLYHVYEEKLNYISHGNWVIFWDQDEAGIGDIRVIFRIVDFHFEENTDSIDSIQAALSKALENEDYEYAAVLRDTLSKKKND